MGQPVSPTSRPLIMLLTLLLLRVLMDRKGGMDQLALLWVNCVVVLGTMATNYPIPSICYWQGDPGTSGQPGLEGVQGDFVREMAEVFAILGGAVPQCMGVYGCGLSCFVPIILMVTLSLSPSIEIMGTWGEYIGEYHPVESNKKFGKYHPLQY